MQELDEISQWLALRGEAHELTASTTLPDPCFLRDGREYVSFSTNNYLALTTDPRLIAAAQAGLARYGVGNCESRLLGGDLELYRDLEGRLAAISGKSDAVLFASGYLSNLGALPALVRGSQLARLYGFKPSRTYRYTFFSDELNHVSINEGIRLSGADKVTYRHADLNQLEDRLRSTTNRDKIIVTDGVFSQDGDIAPLPELMQLADRYDAMVYVDDAHGVGVLGHGGNGTPEHCEVQGERLIFMGTLSKAFGVNGGFVAASASTALALRLSSPAYGFTGSILPDQACALIKSLSIVADEPDRRKQLWDNQRYFVARVQRLGFRIVSSQTPIVPVLVGDESLADRMAATLRHAGIYVDAVKFPAVGLHQSRLRFIMNARHTREQIDDLLAVLASMAPEYVDPGAPIRRTEPTRTVAARVDATPVDEIRPLSGVQSQVLDELVRIAQEDLGVHAKIELHMSLRADLNLDSMALMIVAGAMEDRFGVSFESADGAAIETVADLLAFVERHAGEKVDA
jgi:glycine C-acetyltransferase